MSETLEIMKNMGNASHRWAPEFASRSLHVGFVVDETGSG